MQRLSRIVLIAFFILVSQTGLTDTLENTQIKKADASQRSELQKLSDKVAKRAWEALRAGRDEDARYRFNQALQFDRDNSYALWGLAVLHANKGEYANSISIFEKLEPILSNDVNFCTDYARALGHAGVAAQNKTIIAAAIERFKKTYEKVPQHTMNLQNWAVILYYLGNYAEAWEKVKLAEATAGASAVDRRFVSALNSKMARP